jgi:hypothetical protein
LNKFYCQGTTALFHNLEFAPLRMRQTEFSLSLGKVGDEIAVLPYQYFYWQGTRALSNNQETAPLRMRQIEFSLTW